MKVLEFKLVLIKEHKVLVEYAEVDTQGQKLSKPIIQPIYIRKNAAGDIGLPAAYTITLTPTET